MDKLERLLNLTAALLHAEIPLTAEELRDRVGGYPDTKATFRRAFERDKDDLRSMGMPLRVEPVPGVDPPVDATDSTVTNTPARNSPSKPTSSLRSISPPASSGSTVTTPHS